jgi:hypothetical protein
LAATIANPQAFQLRKLAALLSCPIRFEAQREAQALVAAASLAYPPMESGRGQLSVLSCVFTGKPLPRFSRCASGFAPKTVFT